jgi:hypothetical protein
LESLQIHHSLKFDAKAFQGLSVATRIEAAHFDTLVL